MWRRAPSSRTSIQPRPSSVSPDPQSSPAISLRRRPPGKAGKEDRPIAQVAQVEGEGGEHVQKIFGEEGLLLGRRTALPAADAGHDEGDGAVLAIKRRAPLAECQAIADSRRSRVPGDGRAAPALLLALGTGGEIEPDGRGIGQLAVEPAAPTPARELAPVGVVDAGGVFGA